MSTIELFEDRKDYKEFDGSIIGISNFEDFKMPNPVDLWYDKPFYGRIDEQGDVIHISKDTFAAQEKVVLISDGVYAVDFVAIAFERMKRRIDNIIAMGSELGGPSIALESIFKSFKPKKGFQSVDELYDVYMEEYFNTFSNRYLRATSRDKQVKDFSDFLFFFIKFVDRHASEMPITKTGFIKSNFCSPMVSGLMIETSFDSHNDDEQKGNYIDDLSFTFYHSLAKQYGFYVDKNAPWRLVANLGSPRMQRYWIRVRRKEGAPGWPDWVAIPGIPSVIALKVPFCKEIPEPGAPGGPPLPGIVNSQIEQFLQPTSVHNFFKTYYNKSHEKDIQLLKTKIVDAYNQYVSLYPKVIIENDVTCATKIFLDAGGNVNPTNWRRTLSRRVFERKEITMAEAWALTRTPKLFAMYLSMRIQEEDVNISQPEFNEILRNSLRIFNYKDQKDLDNGNTMRYINNAVKNFPGRIGRVMPFIFDEPTSYFLPPSSPEYENYVPEY